MELEFTHIERAVLRGLVATAVDSIIDECLKEFHESEVVSDSVRDRADILVSIINKIDMGAI